MGKVIGRFGKTCGGCNCNNATEPSTQPDTEDVPCLECDSTDEVPCRYAVIFQCGLAWPLVVKEGETTSPFGFTGQTLQMPMTFPVVELKKDCICGPLYSQRGYSTIWANLNGPDVDHSILIDANLIDDLDTGLPFWKFPPYALTGDPPKIEYRGAKWQRKYENGTAEIFNLEVECLNRAPNVCFALINELPIPAVEDTEPFGLKLWNLDIESDPPKLVWGDFGGPGSIFPDGTTYNDMMTALGRNLPIYVADGTWDVWGPNSMTLQNPGDWINLPRQVCVVPVDQRESRTEAYEGLVPRFNLNKHCVDRQSSCKCCDNGNDLCIQFPPCNGPAQNLFLTRIKEEVELPEGITWPTAATPCYVHGVQVPNGGPYVVIYCDGETYLMDLWCYDDDEEEWVKEVDGLVADSFECGCQEPRFEFTIPPIPCCAEDVQTCCCDEAVPANLTISFDCEGFGDDNEFTLTYDEGAWRHQDGEQEIRLLCIVDDMSMECVFVLDVRGTFGDCTIGESGGFAFPSFPIVQCDPVLMTGQIAIGDGPCSCNPVSYTITA